MENHLTEIVTHLAFVLTVILIAAKIGGEICERYLKVPAVLGELVAGVLIGPHALGGMTILGMGPLFESLHVVGSEIAVIPVSTELWAIAQIAAVVLLFSAGLETDLGQFLRYAGPATVVAAGGVIFPFLAGAYAVIIFGYADSFTDPLPLFMGALMTATSVGITARVLSERRKLGTPEGVTILAAAVIDDVVGILVLTIVVGIAATGEFSSIEVAKIGAKAIGFWLALMTGGILLARHISRLFGLFQVNGANLALALALAFLAAALAESFGLAMIIGAYSIGLALERTSLARAIEEPLAAISSFLVPIFFVVMGMLVDIQAMQSLLLFGSVLTILAVVSKVFGSAVPALAVGFTRIGSLRVGIGMLPRGEVALIIAGIGLSRGILTPDFFGVAILMTMVTTLLAPVLLVPAFEKGGDGRRDAEKVGGE